MSEQPECVCIACRKAMQNYFSDGMQPDSGLSFSTTGHYGSTVFDPMDGSHIEICVCDECLTKAAAEGLVYKAEMPQLVKYKVAPWDGTTPTSETVEDESALAGAARS